MAQTKIRVRVCSLVMSSEAETSLTISDGAVQPETFADSSTPVGMTKGPVRHLYVHIPFCARICPYCAFYKELIDRSQTQRFCEAFLRELRRQAQEQEILLRIMDVGGGTTTALSTEQLEFLVNGLDEATK